MLIVIPYPNNVKFITVDQHVQNRDLIHAFRKEVLAYCSLVCSGPWESDQLDILYNGIRVRLGRQQDYFMLKLKYGSAEEYR